MKYYSITGILIFVWALQAASAQTSVIHPWLSANQQNSSVYRPEPILFVHGINDNDAGWQIAINALHPIFSLYQEPDSLPRDRTRERASQYAFLHTFNYGNYVKADQPDNAQSFDHIEWNAWGDDKRTRSFTNQFLRVTATNIVVERYDASEGRYVSTVVTLPPDTDRIHNPPSDDRIALDERIDEIQSAYRPSQDSDTVPQVVLVAHSMGGLLSHYYLCKCAEATQVSGVRRLVTLATPHRGSPIANDNYKNFVINPADRITHCANLTFWYKVPRLINSDWDSVGFTRYPAKGALEDLSVSMSQPTALALSNDLQTYFVSHSAPRIEYVFNGFTMPTFTHYKAIRFTGAAAAWSDVKNGDGLVSLHSAASKSSQIDSSNWAGQDPVFFGPWPGDHSDANKHIPSLFASLFGVPYKWPGPPARPPLDCNVAPTYARTYDENQSFSKYLPWEWWAWTDNESAWASDEPGINNMVLLCKSSQPHPLVMPRSIHGESRQTTAQGLSFPRRSA